MVRLEPGGFRKHDSRPGSVVEAHRRGWQVCVKSSIDKTRKSLPVLLACTALVLVGGAVAHADSLDGALARAYSAHPSLNAMRANVRAVDETVPQALSGYRPRVNATISASREWDEVRLPGSSGRGGQSQLSDSYPRSAGIQVDQTIFNGFRTQNRVRSAESGVLAARETLRNSEQQILYNAVQVYMDVLRDTATLNLRRNNVEVIEEQLRQTRDRFAVGEVTRTDVSQSESRLEGARSQAIAAEATLKASLARYRQQIGAEPRQLSPGRPADAFLPKSLDVAVNRALLEHPSITSALHNVDFAEFNSKVIEGELYPTLTVSGRATQSYDTSSQYSSVRSASVLGTLTIPIYEGGEVYSRVRSAKETIGQRRLEVDIARDTVRATVIAAWGQLEASKAQIQAAQAQVQAEEIALAGVREEAKVGQRTTLDVLNEQQVLFDARVSLVSAQRDRVVASYLVLQSVGRLSANTLRLKTASYDPKVHFDQVKDKLWGTQIPDGR